MPDTDSGRGQAILSLNAYSPAEIQDAIERIGVTKADMPFLPCFMLGVVAGGSIGFGALYYTIVASDAELSFAIAFTYVNDTTPHTIAVHYRLNGGAWRDPIPKPDYAAEQACSACPGPTGGTGSLFNFPIDLADLRSGANTIGIAVDNTSNSWPPILSNLELLTYH